MKIAKDAAVTINFKMTDNKGNLIDSTEDDDLTYLHGSENILPGLESALEGLESGNSFDITLKPEEGFGEQDDEKIISVEKKNFDGKSLEVGMQFQSVDEDENVIIAKIIKIDGESVTVDENHPLAGVTLVFKGEVLDIREATEEELSHGHIHSGDGHHHDHDHEHDGCCGHEH